MSALEELRAKVKCESDAAAQSRVAFDVAGNVQSSSISFGKVIAFMKVHEWIDELIEANKARDVHNGRDVLAVNLSGLDILEVATCIVKQWEEHDKLRGGEVPDNVAIAKALLLCILQQG